jgi:pimeloyl-ACP methyl ester carboxylesterase
VIVVCEPSESSSERTIVHGVDLDVEDLPGDEPVLVLLHEGLGSIGLWRRVPAALHDATGRRTVTYSRAGYGRSGPVPLPRPLTYMHDEADVVLPALLAGLGIERPVLVGHSDGASIALLAAGAGVPVTALVLLAPHVIVEDVSVAAIAAARTAYADTDLRDRLARHHDHVDVAFRGWNDAWLDPAFRDWDITDRLSGITAPVLVIQGAADPYGTTRQLDLIEAGLDGPFERIVLPGVGHAPHLEAADEVLAAIAAFVARR